MASSDNVEGVDLENQVASSAPVLTGGRAQLLSTVPARTNFSAVTSMHDLQGRQITMQNSPMYPPIATFHGPVSAVATDNGEIQVIPAPPAGFALCVTCIQAFQASNGANIIFWRMGLAGPIVWRMLLQSNGDRNSIVYFDPPLKLPAQTPLVGFSSATNDVVYFNAHFFATHAS